MISYLDGYWVEDHERDLIRVQSLSLRTTKDQGSCQYLSDGLNHATVLVCCMLLRRKNSSEIVWLGSYTTFGLNSGVGLV